MAHSMVHVDGPNGQVTLNTPGGSVVSGIFVTSDSKDQVLAFYKDKLGSEASVFDTSHSSVLSVKKGDQETVMVTVTQKPGEDDGKTKIAIVHTKNIKSS